MRWVSPCGSGVALDPRPDQDPFAFRDPYLLRESALVPHFHAVPSGARGLLALDQVGG